MFFKKNKISMNDVKIYYKLFLERKATVSELENWQEKIDKKITLENFIKTFLYSQEYIKKQKNINIENMNFSHIASQEDILSAFRLLLNRYPSKSEWYGHKQTAGTELEEIVIKFLTSSEFQKRALVKPSLNSSGHEIIEKENFKIVVSKDDNVCGQVLLNNKEYEPHITNLLKYLLQEKMTFIDIGANIGYFSLLASSIVGKNGKVIAIEPYSYNVKLLYLNKNINNFNQIDIIPFAATNQKGLLNYDDSAGNSGNILDLDKENINSILNSNLIYGITLDKELSSYKQKIDIIKIDVEGAEYLSLNGFKNRLLSDRPLIITELSNNFLQAISKVSLRKYIEFILIDDFYRLGIILKNKVQISKNIEEIITYCNEAPFGLIDIVSYPSDKYDLDIDKYNQKN